jgi:MFS family permease
LIRQRVVAGASEAARARQAVAAIFCVNGAVLGTWAAHIAPVQSRLDLGPATLGLALLAMAAGALVAMPAAGVLIGRYGSAPVTRACVLALCAGLPLPALAPGTGWLAVALFLFGAANGATDVAMNAHGVAVERRLGRPTMSYFHAMFSVGGLLGAAVTGALLIGLSAAAQVLLGATAFAAVAVAAAARLLPAAADVGEAGAHFALPRRHTLLVGALAFGTMLAEGAMLDWSGVYLKTAAGAEAPLAAAGFAAFSGAMALARFAGDRLRLRYGSRWLLRCSAGLAAGGVLLAVAVPTPALAVAGFALAGLGIANMVPLLFGVAGRSPDQRPGEAIAAVATIGYSGLLAGPPLVGLLAEATTLAVGLGAVAAALLLVALAAGRVRWAD